MEKQIVKIDYKILRLKDLKETAGNPQKMTPVEFQGMVNSMRKDGWILDAPVIWHRPDGEMQIISGHHRVRAGIDAGILETGCKVIEGITEEKALLKVIEANQRRGTLNIELFDEIINKIHDDYNYGYNDIFDEIGLYDENDKYRIDGIIPKMDDSDSIGKLDKSKEIKCPSCGAVFEK
jgi:ParB-like chromosome segregation protein Spo0J